MSGSLDAEKVAAVSECNYVSEIVLQFKEHVRDIYWRI